MKKTPLAAAMPPPPSVAQPQQISAFDYLAQVLVVAVKAVPEPAQHPMLAEGRKALGIIDAELRALRAKVAELEAKPARKR